MSIATSAVQFRSTRCAVFEAISKRYSVPVPVLPWKSHPFDSFLFPEFRKTVGTYWTFTRDAFPVKSTVPRVNPSSAKTIGTYWTFTRDTFPVKSTVPRVAPLVPCDVP